MTPDDELMGGVRSVIDRYHSVDMKHQVLAFIVSLNNLRFIRKQIFKMKLDMIKAGTTRDLYYIQNTYN